MALAFVGCQTTETADTIALLGPTATNHQMARVAKRDWQRCVDAFYDNNWKQVAETVKAMGDLAHRWSTQAPPPGKDLEFKKLGDEFGAAVNELLAASNAQDTVKTTYALQTVIAKISALDAMLPKEHSGDAPVLQTRQPSTNTSANPVGPVEPIKASPAKPGT